MRGATRIVISSLHMQGRSGVNLIGLVPLVPTFGAFGCNMSRANDEDETMADAPTKITIFFGASGGTAPTGWTENYWSGQVDLNLAIELVKNNYIKPRAALLGQGARIESIRAATNPPSRVTQVRFITGKEGDPSLFTTSPADDYDPTQVDLLCRATTAAGKRRQLWIGGLPDSQTDQLIAQGILGAFIASPAWKQFVAGIIKAGLFLRFKATNGPPPTYLADPIADVAPIMVRNRKRGRPFELFRGRRIA